MRLSRLEIASESNLGRIRRNNEDFHRVVVQPTPLGNLVLLAVADGMGGTEAGEWASKLAIEGMTDALRAYAQQLAMGRSTIPPLMVMERAFRLAQHRILREAERTPERRGMGTTLTALLLSEWNFQAALGHVGDTRAYRWRSGNWEQLTQDHSWVAQQVRQGVLSPSEAEVHPWRHMLTHALGLKEVQPEFQQLTFLRGEVLVVATDGLYTLVPPEEWRIGQDLHASLIDWVNRALLRGGSDNITAIAVRFI
jgi:serine/threonine protein phosphatase PrpC